MLEISPPVTDLLIVLQCGGDSGGSSSGGGSSTPSTPSSAVQLGGQDRIDTAIAISQNSFPSGCPSRR